MRQRRKHLTRGAAVLLGGTVALALGGALVFADGGSLNVEVADRTGYAYAYTTPDNALVEYIGDLNETFGSSGSGVFDSFVRLQAEPDEAGYNTDGTLEYDTKAGAFTHSIKVSDIPVISIGGVPHWELFADINDSDNTPLISLNELEIFFTADKNLTGYPFPGTASKVYDFLGSIHINDVNQGSGRGDLRYNVPLTNITIPAECGYKDPDCATYFVLYSQWGTPTSGATYASDGGFEEWKVKEYPYVVVTKTAATTFTRTFPWTIDKTVTPAAWDLFTGESGTSQYGVTVTKGTGIDSGWAVSGSISINNPGADSAVIESVADVVSGAGEATVSCGVSFPYTLPKNQTLNCTYSKALPDGASRTNTATVELDYGGLFTGTAAVTFGAPTTLVNDTINVTDTLATLGSTSATKTWNYTKTFTCDADEGTTNNTATITETGQSDSASVTVNCHEISVTKNAATSLTRTYNWTIDKSVTPASWAMFTGDSGTSEYTVVVDKTGSTDSAWAASGTITISNPNPIAATINSVSDTIAGGINATVDCGVGPFPRVIAAQGSLVCSYTATLPDGTTRLNTATAVRQNHNYTYQGVASNGGTTPKSGTASVDFSSATVTPVNATINVSDSLQGALGSASDDTTFTYPKTFTCDANEGTTNNTATITETGQNDSASVTVACYEINVTKDATETYQRKYHWTIDKSSTDSAALTLKPGETYADYPYSITVGLAAEPFTDSDWAVNGNIHVNNPNPIAATINSVSDVLATDGAATVDCGAAVFPYTLAANSSLDCTYSKALPGKNDQLNTATAVRQGYTYDKAKAATAAGTVNVSGTANVDFNGPTTLIDESVTIVDDNGTPGNAADDRSFGPLLAADAPKTYTYKRTFGPYTTEACGEVVIKNTATFTTNDTGASGSDDWTVTITIPCPTGCTLTQGYWKTHSEEGPAPEDEDWYNIGDVDGDGVSEGPNEDFFLSGMTWHDVFWTPPKGDAYFNLAHQYMAAKLNILSPADSPQAVDDAIMFAESFFATHTPGTKLSKVERAAVIGAAGVLGAYNEGTTGPGHCSEDGIARSAS